MLKLLKKKLVEAEGRSEFIIAVFCDIRGFSQFSAQHESSDTAMFIKRFYVKLLNDYFPDAVFAKPTGDGLLIVFRYKEKTLLKTSNSVVEGCFRALQDYRAMFHEDPMINYEIPGSIGFGISRGSACCLFSGQTILDYSGALLNLAARLNDFARPSGIVVDGNYMLDVIPEQYQGVFQSQSVFVRGIAESTPLAIWCSSEVEVPAYALTPTRVSTLKKVEASYSGADVLVMSAWYNIRLPSEPVEGSKPIVEFVWPIKRPKGHFKSMEVVGCKVTKRAEGAMIRVNMENVHRIIRDEKIPKQANVKFRVQYSSS